ncbi:hypothetical protein ACHQM5_015913 [Ranunculus cassubicifolius]
MRDWSNLPTELLELFLERLVPNFVDVIRFRAVCKSWQFISLNKPTNPPPQLPWLMLPSHGTIPSRRRFFSPSENRVYSVPESWGCYCSGSSHGWLIMEDSFILCSLFNPITGVQIVLPLIKSVFGLGSPFCESHIKFSKQNQERFIVKAVLSSSPSLGLNADCFVMMIFGLYQRYLAYCKLGDKNWTLRPTPMDFTYEDIICFQGKFYVVDSYGKVLVFDLRCSSVSMEFKRPESFKADKSYLVELAGDILLIRRFRGWSFDLEKVYKTVMFKVLRQDLVKKNWVEVKTLQNHALFLGHNHSMSVLALDFPECRANCIYFTDNCFKDYGFEKAEPHDVGIFNLVDGSIEPLPGYVYDSHFIKQPPVWIMASPW